MVDSDDLVFLAPLRDAESVRDDAGVLNDVLGSSELDALTCERVAHV